MEKLEVTFRIVTPMFLGGADPNIQAELRPPSIKGAMRYWYRAIYPNEDHKVETRIFGGTDADAGQARILLRLSDIHQIEGKKEDARWAKSKIPYLGYGIFSLKETGEYYTDSSGRQKERKEFRPSRPFLDQESSFKLTIIFKPFRAGEKGKKYNEKDYKQDKIKVQQALWAMVMFGGLGARSRKGFGSLVVTEQNGMDNLPSLMPQDINELEQAIKDFMDPLEYAQVSLPDNPADFTCFTQDSRCILIKHHSSADKAFVWLADKVHSCRSYRSKSHYEIAGEDHDKMRDFIASGKVPDSPPKRAAFGLPHNYFFSSISGDRKKGNVDFMDGNQ